MGGGPGLCEFVYIYGEWCHVAVQLFVVPVIVIFIVLMIFSMIASTMFN